MNVTLCRLLILLPLVASAGAMAQSSPAGKPAGAPVDFGLMLNEDGDIVFAAASEDSAATTQKLRASLDGIKSIPVQTLVYNIACGSDILHYPTKVGSIWGWRKTSKEDAAPWTAYMAAMRPAAEAGLDSVGIAAAWAADNKIHFVPSYRINDAHYCADPDNNPLTGAFWVTHRERFELKQSPVAEVENYRHLLDFAHPEVRAFRLAIMVEAIERYQHKMQGFQIDFFRHPVLFVPGNEEKNAPLITEMVRAVRTKLKELEARNSRPYALMVRVPPTLRHCWKVGLDVERWMAEGLVDVVTPSQGMTLSYDMPVNEFAALAKPHGIQVYPALLAMTQFAWPFTFSPTAESYAGAVTNSPSATALRGAAINLRAMGAANFELYNFNLPTSATETDGIKLVASAGGDRVYGITPRYWIDTTDAFEPVKQLPARLEAGESIDLTLWIGEDPTAEPIEAALRIGIDSTVKKVSSLPLMISINGQQVYDGLLSQQLAMITGKIDGRGWRNHPPPVAGYVQVPIERPSVLKQGANEITLKLGNGSADDRFSIVSEVQVGVRSKAK